MIITPWKELAGTADYLPTAANFPMLKHFFPCTAESGLATLTDSVGGVAVTFADGYTVHASKSQCIDVGATAGALGSGTLSSPGTKSMVVVSVGIPDSSAATVVFGSVSAAGNSGIRINSAGATSRTAAATNGAGTALCTDGPTGATTPLALAAQLAIVPSSTSTLHFCGYDGTTFTNYTDKTIASTPSGGMTAIDQAMIINTGSNPGCIFVLHPTTSFSNAQLQAIAAWAYWAVFTANAGAGDKTAVIAPWLRGHA